MEYASKGVAGAGLGTGIAGLSLGVLNSLGNGGLLGNLLGGNCNAMCHENMPVSRYEMSLNQKNADQASEIALLKADAYTNQKFADLNDRYNDRFRNIEAELARNAVKQQAVDDSIMLVNERLECCKTNIMERLCREIDDRKCGDNTIINYLNATFYAKQVADVTTGTTTTPQSVYNPLPIQCCGR
jgi:hypothetical protein